MVYDLSKLKEDQEPEYIELYPSEMNELKVISAKLQNKFGFKKMTDRVKHDFTQEVEGEFEKIGLRVRVTWTVDVSGDSDSDLFHIPTISVVGRTEREKETDFDRIQNEIVAGELDGETGFIREDGSRREDARSKNV